MGDAAHALPPSSGQGVNQTLEDVQALVWLWKGVKRDEGNARKGWAEVLKWWEEQRKGRVEQVYAWATGMTNVQRLSESERKEEMEQGTAKKVEEGDDMRWLYVPQWEERVRKFLDAAAA